MSFTIEHYLLELLIHLLYLANYVKGTSVSFPSQRQVATEM